MTLGVGLSTATPTQASADGSTRGNIEADSAAATVVEVHSGHLPQSAGAENRLRANLFRQQCQRWPSPSRLLEPAHTWVYGYDPFPPGCIPRGSVRGAQLCRRWGALRFKPLTQHWLRPRLLRHPERRFPRSRSLRHLEPVHPAVQPFEWMASNLRHTTYLRSSGASDGRASAMLVAWVTTVTYPRRTCRRWGAWRPKAPPSRGSPLGAPTR
jgi:hypothetical protein